MIAKLKSTFLFSVLILCSTTTLAKLPNQYQKIIQQYKIQPPDFEYGYPLWYKLEEQPIRGVIFLTNEAEYLDKRDDRTYVTQPTRQNAKIIAAFSAPPEDFAKYYVVVDERVEQNEMNLFLEELGFDEPWVDICFVGKTGNYIKVNYYNRGYFYDSSFDGVTSCGTPQIWQMRINSMDDLMLEYKIMDLTGVFDFTLEHYYEHGPTNPKFCNQCPRWSKMNKERCTTEIEYFETKIENTDKDTGYYVKELLKWRIRRGLVDEYGVFYVPNKSFAIHIRMQRYATTGMYFNVLNQFEKGFFYTRNEIALKKWNVSYADLMKEREKEMTRILDLMYPDKFVYHFNSIQSLQAPSPPIIEEIEIIEIDDE